MTEFQNLHWELLDAKDYFTLTVNLLMFIFARKLIFEKDDIGNPVKDYSLKVFILRGTNLVFFLVYIILFILNKPVGTAWIQSYLLVLSSFIFSHWINHWIILKYGDHESVDGEVRVTDNYLSQLLVLSVITSFVLLTAVSLLYIWDMQSLLQSGSIFVTIAIIIFATKEFWLEEVMSSFVIHAKGRLKRGTIVELDDGNLYIILETNFIGSKLKNLKTEEFSTIANTKFVRDQVKILSLEKKQEKVLEENGKKPKKEWKSVKRSIDFNIGYNSSYEEVKTFFDHVIEESIKECPAIGSYSLNLKNNGDHAVVWEVLYYVNSPYQILQAKNTINLIAFLKQKEFNIDLSTPITHSKV